MYTCLLVSIALLPVGLFAQPGAAWWQPVSSRVLPESAAAQAVTQATYFQLDLTALQQWLDQAPQEHASQRLSVQLPSPQGSMMRFHLTRTPVLAPGLAARYPHIQTFAGQGLDDPTMTLRCDLTDYGFHAMVRGPQGTYFIEPVNQQTTTFYRVFEMKHVVADDNVVCGVHEAHLPELPQFLGQEAADRAHERRGSATRDAEAGDQLFTYNLAVACDFPFCNSATSGNPTKLGVLSVVTTIINQINGVWEEEATIRFVLNNNTDDLFFVNQATDPYTFFGTTGNSREMLDKNPQVIDSVLGINNYDIGHGFSRAGSSQGITVVGTGYFRSVCASGQGTLFDPHRANGASVAIGLPQSLQFLRTLAHELGHQFNARHSFNISDAVCGPARDGTRPFEPESGSTIMSYAGACSGDLQGSPDLYFNTGSYELIHQFSRTSTPCLEAQATTGNTAPTINSTGISGTHLPVQTPFELTVDATDAETPASLTYNWEQADIGPAGRISNPQGNAPIFRSFPATTDPTRVFPRLVDVLNGNISYGEAYPTYSRNLTFRITVRDNAPGGGGLTYEEITFDVTDEAGPFLVTEPNGQESLTGGDVATVTWDPANTELAPVNCEAVDIYLSTDGGFTFSTLLAEDVPNTGSYRLFMPDVSSTTCRLKIKAADNVFFDVSDQNFTIESAGFPDVAALVYDDPVFICPGVESSFLLYTSGIGGFNGPLTLNLAGLPQGVAFTTEPAQPSAGDTILVQLDAPGGIATGASAFTIFLSGSGGASDNLTVNLLANEGLSADPVLDGPATGLTDQSLRPSFSWQPTAGALSYIFELSSSPTFDAGSLIETADNLTATDYTLSSGLAGNQVYYWRVGAINDCVDGRFSRTGAFQTSNCETYVPTDLPKNIPVNNTPQTVISSVVVPASGEIESIAVQNVRGTHGNVNDLTFVLRKAGSVQAELIRRPCPLGASNFNLSFADLTPAVFPPCPPTDGGVYSPREPLSVFLGEEANGAYSLRVIDNEDGNGGELQNWELELCLAGAVPVSITTNDTLYLLRSEEKPIGNDLLSLSSTVSSAATITYTLVSAPEFGSLKLNGQALATGDVFTQADIDAGDLAYEQDGSEQPYDGFDFSTLDGEQGWSGLRTFDIRVTDVTSVAQPEAQPLRVYPNPTTGRLTVALPTDMSAATLTLFDQQGRALQRHSVQGQPDIQLDLQGLTQGLYLLRLQAGGQTWQEKVQLK